MIKQRTLLLGGKGGGSSTSNGTGNRGDGTASINSRGKKKNNFKPYDPNRPETWPPFPGGGFGGNPIPLDPYNYNMNQAGLGTMGPSGGRGPGYTR